MKLISDGKFYKVPESRLKSKGGLLNYQQKRGDSIVKVESCLVNEFALRRQLKLDDDEVLILERNNAKDYGYVWPPDRHEIPEDLRARLKSFQVADVEKMLQLRGCLNRNKMGAGKTIEAIALMKTLGLESALIFAPKSTLLQWKRQFEKWYPEEANRVEICPENPKLGMICLYNYEKLVRNDKLLERLRSFVWPICICDEAHRLKNRSSKRTTAVKSIAATRKLAMTGTPIMNKPDDLWSILDWLNPYYAGRSYWNFTYYFCNIKVDPWGQKPDGLTKDSSRVEILKQLLDTVSVYNDLEFATSKEIYDVSLEMEKPQKDLFTKAKKLVLDELPENMTIANGAVLAMRLQQTTSWPGLFDDEKKKYGPGVKFEWIQDLLDDNPEEKFVFFTRFATTAKALQNYLSQRSTLYLGSMSGEAREQSKMDFIENEDTRGIIGTVAAMGEGVDGLQSVSRTAVFIDKDWTPSILEQCEQRLNRPGQTRPVSCYYLECENSFDQYVGKIVLTKSEDIRRVLS